MMIRTPLLLIILALGIASCSSLPGDNENAGKPLLSEAEQVQALLESAARAASPQREAQLLQAAELLLDQQQYNLAQQTIEPIEPQTLTITSLARYSQLRAALAIKNGLTEEALVILDNSRLLEQQDQLSLEQQRELTLLRAECYALLGQHIASARQRMYIAPLLSEEQGPANRQALWQSLMYIRVAELEQYLRYSFGDEEKGWLTLALIAKDNQGDLDKQVAQLESWQASNQQHPAATDLPGGLALIKELAANRPERVAILLPLTGKLAPYGKAIRDGFIAASYQTRQAGGSVPQLRIYDTALNSDFMALYRQAIDDGAQLVIGPLQKQHLRLLFDEGMLPVPTLALNRVDDYGQAPENMYQFGLVPSDEAIQIADIAYLENHRQALVLAPAGDWGRKVSGAFNDQWASLDDTTSTNHFFSGQADYSSTVKNALLLHESEARSRRIRQLTGEPIEFEPRRRQDIDMVFMLARPQQARSIKPLLAYHYAADLDVYGTSRLYSGYANPTKDRDINGIRFTDMPWVLNADNKLQTLINSEVKDSKQFQRFYALGVDSYQLHPRLRQLESLVNSRVYGQTGTLKLNDKGEIERELLLAQFTRSRAKLVPIVDRSLNATKDGSHGKKLEQKP